MADDPLKQVFLVPTRDTLKSTRVEGAEIMSRRGAYLSAILIGLLFLGSLALTGCDVFRRSDYKRADKGEFTKPTRIPLTVEEDSVFTQGEKVTVCEVSVSVDNVDRKPGEGSGGKDLVVLTLSVTNETTQKNFAIIPFDFYLNDSEGKVIEISYSAYLDNPMDSGSLKPGETVTGDVAYDVAAGKEDLSFFWMPGWCSEKVVIKFS